MQLETRNVALHGGALLNPFAFKPRARVALLANLILGVRELCVDAFHERLQLSRFGLGHVQGIKEHWNKEVDREVLLRSPPQSKRGPLPLILGGVTFLSLASYLVFRLLRRLLAHR